MLSSSYAKDEIAEVAKELLAAEGKSMVFQDQQSGYSIACDSDQRDLGNYGPPFLTTLPIRSKRVLIRQCQR